MDIVIIDKIEMEMITLVMTSQVMMTVMLLISLTPGTRPIRGLHGLRTDQSEAGVTVRRVSAISPHVSCHNIVTQRKSRDWITVLLRITF